MVSFIYFDLGGVIELDFSGTNKWNEMKNDLGVNKENEAAYEAIWKRYQNEICLSRDVDSLMPILKREAGIIFPDGYSLLVDFVNRFEKNPSIWPVVQKASEKYKIGLLTNMYPRMFPLIQAKGIIPPVTWSVILDSSIVGYQKPNLEFFKIAEDKAHVKGDKILFIDNSAIHIDAARKLGWNTFLYNSNRPEISSLELSRLLENI